VLGVLSRSWPILSAEVDRETGEQKRLEPEDALSIARREVFAMRKEQLVQGRTAAWDPVTEWYILAWDAIKAREFSFDEARKLAISSGIDASELIQRDHILGRKGDTVSFLQPRERLNRERVNPEALSFTRLMNALHTAMYLYDTEGDRACRRFLERASYIHDNDFRALLEAALRAIPRTRKYDKGRPTGFLLPEMETLERMRVSIFPDIMPPQETANPNAGAEQGSLEETEEEEDYVTEQ
jgi:putative DNA methylase